jgi:hypothetical protein
MDSALIVTIDPGSVVCRACGGDLVEGPGCAVCGDRYEEEPLELLLMAGDACPSCFVSHVSHGGWLHQAGPKEPPLPEPVELLYCWSCRTTFRADGAPYDQAEVSRAWREFEASGGMGSV